MCCFSDGGRGGAATGRHRGRDGAIWRPAERPPADHALTQRIEFRCRLRQNSPRHLAVPHLGEQTHPSHATVHDVKHHTLGSLTTLTRLARQ